MSHISPVGSSGGVGPTQPLKTEKLQSIIDSHYKSVPDTAHVGCNLVIMQPGVEPMCLNAGNLPLNAPQHWGSVTKQFTAACIAKLVADHKINWQDDIREYLPELPEFKLMSQRQKVTIDDLAHMSSGISEVGILAAFSGQDDAMLNMDERLKLLAHCSDLLFLPGSQKMYSNDNYYLLAAVVERVSGRPFVDYVRDEIFTQNEMGCRCSIDPSCPQTVDGYNTNFQLDTCKVLAYGAFDIIGTPTDMAQWNVSIDTGEWNSLMSPPPDGTAPQGKSVYCRGLKVAYTDDYRVVYHTGSINGFCTRFMRYEHLTDPSKSFAFFLATNVNDMQLVYDATEEVADVLAGKDVHIEFDELSELTPTATPIKAALSEAKLYEGVYQCPALGFRYQITAEDNNGVPILHFSFLNPDDSSSVIVDLIPTQEFENAIVYRGPAGDWIELISDGIILKSPKVAPIVFIREV